MNHNGLMEKQDSSLNSYRTAIIGNQNPTTLSERLAALSDKERSTVKLIAPMVYRLSKSNQEPYLSFAKSMYPKVPYSQLGLIAELLEELEPRGKTTLEDEEAMIREKAFKELYEGI